MHARRLVCVHASVCVCVCRPARLHMSKWVRVLSDWFSANMYTWVTAVQQATLRPPNKPIYKSVRQQADPTNQPIISNQIKPSQIKPRLYNPNQSHQPNTSNEFNKPTTRPIAHSNKQQAYQWSNQPFNKLTFMHDNCSACKCMCIPPDLSAWLYVVCPIYMGGSV